MKSGSDDGERKADRLPCLIGVLRFLDAIMKTEHLAERIRLVSRRYSPELPEPRFVCSLVYDKTLEDGRTQYRCSGCHETQVVDGMLDKIGDRVCRGTTDA